MSVSQLKKLAVFAGAILLCASAAAHTFEWFENGEQLEMGDKAPDFTIAVPSDDDSADPAEITLAQFKGEKNLLLVFYGNPGAKVNREKIDALAEESDHFEESEVDLIAVTLGPQEPSDTIKAELELPFIAYSDAEGELAALYRVPFRVKDNGDKISKSAVFLIDKDGIIQHVYYGYGNNASKVNLMKAVVGDDYVDEHADEEEAAEHKHEMAHAEEKEHVHEEKAAEHDHGKMDDHEDDDERDDGHEAKHKHDHK